MWESQSSRVCLSSKGFSSTAVILQTSIFLYYTFFAVKIQRSSKGKSTIQIKPKMSKKKYVQSLMLVCLLRILTLGFASAEKAEGKRKTITVMLETSGIILNASQQLECWVNFWFVGWQYEVSQICGTNLGASMQTTVAVSKTCLLWHATFIAANPSYLFAVIKLICGRREKGIERERNCRERRKLRRHCPPPDLTFPFHVVLGYMWDLSCTWKA